MLILIATLILQFTTNASTAPTTAKLGKVVELKNEANRTLVSWILVIGNGADSEIPGQNFNELISPRSADPAMSRGEPRGHEMSAGNHNKKEI